MSDAAESALALAPAAPGQPLRIVAATYNIHSCVGTDRRYSPGRVAAVLAELDADIIGLQEVDTRLSAGRGLNQGIFLAEALGFHFVAGLNIVEHRGCLGNALLSRWPIVDSRLIDLTAPGREPRGAVVGDIRLPQDDRAAGGRAAGGRAAGGRAAGYRATGEPAPPLRAIVAHFGLSGGERRRQIASLGRLIADDAARQRPLIVMGDFNEWSPWGPVSRALKRTAGRATPVASFPSRWPVLPLDRICGNVLELVEEPSRHVSAAARVASDHLPLKAAFTLLGE